MYLFACGEKIVWILFIVVLKKFCIFSLLAYGETMSWGAYEVLVKNFSYVYLWCKRIMCFALLTARLQLRIRYLCLLRHYIYRIFVILFSTDLVGVP